MNLSVIVPVYNVEQFLPRCIDSIIMQTYPNFEIILVNDGSTDNSGVICNQYKELDSRIKVYDKENGGLSDARNYGLKHANGEYIAFIDSDDFIIETAFEKLLEKIAVSDAEIVVGNGVTYISDNNIKPKCNKRNINDRVYTGAEFLRISLEQKSMSMCVPFNIYKKEFLDRIKIPFKKGILHEDQLWTPSVFLKAQRVVYLDIDFYMHYRREGSITQNKDLTRNGIDLINICYELAKSVQLISDSRTKKVMNDYIVTLYLNGFFVGKLYKKQYRKLLCKKFLLGKSYSGINKMKVLLFIFNKRVYYYTNHSLKIIMQKLREDY